MVRTCHLEYPPGILKDTTPLIAYGMDIMDFRSDSLGIPYRWTKNTLVHVGINIEISALALCSAPWGGENWSID